MNINNLNKLIAHLEVQPPKRINMGFASVQKRPNCGTAGCIVGHAFLLFEDGLVSIFGRDCDWSDLTMPPDVWGEQRGVRRYPAHRVISTLKRLRDTYLATGQVVVDWGPEPGDEPKTPWVAPQVAEVIAPALPAEITSLLHPSPVKTEA